MQTQQIRACLIEDNPVDVLLIKKLLSRAINLSIHIDTAATLADAVSRIAGHPYDIIFLDLRLPDSQGYNTFDQIKTHTGGEIPIIVLTGMHDQNLALQTLRDGAQDYLVKGQINRDLILRSLLYAIERKSAEIQRLKLEKLQGALEMAGGVCHELNQPLQYVAGSAELILMELPDNHPLRETLLKIKTQINRMGQITSKLMRITRYETRGYINGSKIIDIDKSSEN